MKASLTLAERSEPWTLVIEPWALAHDVREGQRVVIDLPVLDAEGLSLEIAESGTFLAFADEHFTVRIGEDVHVYDFRAANS